VGGRVSVERVVGWVCGWYRGERVAGGGVSVWRVLREWDTPLGCDSLTMV